MTAEGRRGTWSDAQAAAILARLKAGETGRDLAAELGVSPMTISNLRNGHTYPHLARTQPPGTRRTVPGSAARQLAAAEFWVKVDRSGGLTACWPWAGTISASGYGDCGLRLPGGPLAYKTAYLIARGDEESPPNQVIRHLCGFKPCCNPGHLLAGTRRENYDDGPASPRPLTVCTPVPPPTGGWLIETGDLELLDVAAKAERYVWPRVDRSAGPDACWPWTSKGGPFGHGNLRWKGRTISTGMAVWIVTHGAIPSGQVVRHHCDNGACCNPQHLCLGTPKDNRNDAKERGRLRTGENHHMGRATPDATVRAARERVKAGETLTAIAADLGVSITTVRNWALLITRRSAGPGNSP